MRPVLFGLALVSLALALAATATGSPEAQVQTGACAKANLDLIEDGRLTLGTDNPAFPPWWGGGQTRKPWKTSNPYSGRGYESAVAYAVARQLGFAKRQVDWRAVPFAQSYRPGDKNFDFYMAQVSYTPERARTIDFSNAYYFVYQSLVGREGTAITRARSVADLKSLSAGGTTRHDELPVHRQLHQAFPEPPRLRLERPRRAGAEERSDRRHRRRLAHGVLRNGGSARRWRDRRSLREPRRDGSAWAWSSRRAVLCGDA